MKRGAIFASVLTFAAVAGLSGSPAMYAAPIYPTTSSVGIVETGLTTPSNSKGYLFHTTISATNNGAVTLYNVFEFSRDLSLNGVAASLTGVGTYTEGSLQAYATNAAVYINPAESDYSFDAASAGSATVIDIPGFLIASSLAPGQTVSFTEDFEVSAAATSLSYGFVNSASTTPEPSEIVLTGTGVLALVGIARRKLRVGGITV